MRSLSIKTTSTSSESVVTHRPPPQSLWQSPVPYLFGGLTIMLVLIALALIILAYSYWRSATTSGGRVDEEKERQSGETAAEAAYEEKILVIMAGDDLPRFLATPAAKRCMCGEQKGNMEISKDGGGGGGDGGDGGENEKVKENE